MTEPDPARPAALNAMLAAGCEPRFMASLADTHGVFTSGGMWFLMRSRDPVIENLFHRGDVFFSRLEGEWCFAPDTLQGAGDSA